MIEFLALPGWRTPPRTVDDWVAALSKGSGPVILTRESSTVSWMEMASLRVRAYVVIENGHASAINFECHGLDPAEPTRIITEVATALGWEIHPDDDDDDPDEDEDD